MMKPTISSFCSLLLTAWMTLGCSSGPENAKPVNEWPAIYPDYVGVTVPVDIAPLDFAMLSDSLEELDVVVHGSQGTTLHARGDFADFDVNEWHQLLASNRGDSLVVTVCASLEGRWLRYRDFTIYVSPDSIGEWGVTYRRIAPGYEMYGQMGLYQRCLSNFDETALMENQNIGGQCINCHTANRTNPGQYVFHVRGENGCTAVQRNGTMELLKAKNDILGGSMVYPYWHPGGRFCAFSTNKTSQMFHTGRNKRIEVYDSSSDVFVYDTETRTLLKDTLLMRKYWAENTPAFSPDGQWLYFTTARRQLYPTDYDKERYSLCRVSFDEHTGRLGTRVDTLLSADRLGKSISWPRPSYDGRYLMYTQTDYGYFSIWHPEADLWLTDLQTGVSRPMDEVNTERAESFHNWSTNSRWFLFTSRRDDGLYTRLYFSSMGDDGRATKPFMLPQRDPKRYYRLLLHSYNTPDFTLRPVNADIVEVAKSIESGQRIDTKVEECND